MILATVGGAVSSLWRSQARVVLISDRVHPPALRARAPYSPALINGRRATTVSKGQLAVKNRRRIDQSRQFFPARPYSSGWRRGYRLEKLYWPSTKRRSIQFRTCLFVCMSVCLSDDTFRIPWHRKFIFSHSLYLERIRIRFVYEGHRVKVKVTWAKMVEYPFSHNVKLRSAITLVLWNIEPWRLHAACGFRILLMEWWDRHLCHVTAVTTRN